ncbi:FkbM family methyltransferase [Sphaerospermopsis aphanizomenoides BCCUSP55]|uniref:FkbM family methyltransferase n=1 Tax=Sphaerospermopsis aphanizomenoides TaxID=459663 RepID=UPI001907BBB5|nr:FkbM family methyltransferase [Sphaerospermopsis aphanizomenoides]MBK1988970.1 FkbM family methyltransferase [Sphaerospermopsis aphanizomenoides BCCUSP55]
MKLEAKLIQLFPQSLRLPVLYNYRKLRKRIEQEILYLDQFLHKGKRAIDIGANEGIYSYALAQRCEIVEAFEPQPWCTEALKAYSQSGNKNINVYNVGLSNFNGTLNLNIPVSISDYSLEVDQLGNVVTGLASFRNIPGETSSFEVPVCKLDDYNFDHVSFIKIDVEGHESQVLEGGYQTIIREKPTILIEIEQRHLGNKSITEVFRQITELGYEGSFFNKNQLQPLAEFSYQEHQESFLNKIYSEQYVNNFIFTPVVTNKV